MSPRGKGGRCLGLTTFPPTCADFLENLGALSLCSPRDMFRPV